MNLNRYTEKAQESVLAAQQLAERAGNPEVLPEHLLAALVTQRDGIVPAILGKMQLDATAIGAGAHDLLKALPRAQGGAQPGLSSRLRSITSAAEQEAERLKDEYTSTEHLFVALASEGGRSASAKFLQQQAISKDAVLQALTPWVLIWAAPIALAASLSRRHALALVALVRRTLQRSR